MSLNYYIILADEQTKYNIEHAPEKTKNITAGFYLCQFADKELNNYKLKTVKNDIIPLNEYKDKSIYLVHSPIYKNTYYTIDTFDDCFKNDLADVIKGLAIMMGARSISLDYSEKLYTRQNKKNHTNINVGANTDQFSKILSFIPFLKNHVADSDNTMGDVNVKWENKNLNESEHKKIYKNMYKTTFNQKTSMSKEELAKYINSNSINIDSITILKHHINKYLYDATIDGNLDSQIYGKEYLKEVHDKYNSISLSMDTMPEFIKASFGINWSRYSEKEKKMIDDFKVSITF